MIEAPPEPKLYSIYQKITLPDGRTDWFGTHRLPIRTALKLAEELRNGGHRVVWRKDGEFGPTYKD